MEKFIKVVLFLALTGLGVLASEGLSVERYFVVSICSGLASIIMYSEWE